MNILLNQKEIESGIRTFMAEKYDVLTVHTKVQAFIYGENIINAVARSLHYPDYKLSEKEIEESIGMYLEEYHGFDSSYTKVVLLPSEEILEAVVSVKPWDIGEEF